MKLVKRYFSFLTSLIFFNYIIRILSNKVNEKNLDYSFSFNSEKISSNKLKIEMLDYNNHSLSDLSKLILIRTSFDRKNDEIEIKINNSNFNGEKNKIYFILDFFDYEIYQVKNIYNKNNILIKSFLKTENNIFRLNEIRKLDDISFSPNSFQANEPIKILVINSSETCTQNFSLDLIYIDTNKSLDQKHQYLSPIESKIRFILTVSKPGIFRLVVKCINKTIEGLNNSKLYIYNSHVTLVRKKDYILNNTGNNKFPIYLKYPVLEGQFSIKKKRFRRIYRNNRL